MKVPWNGSRKTKEECFMLFIVLEIWTGRLSVYMFCFFHLIKPALFFYFFFFPLIVVFPAGDGRFYTECLGMKLLRKRDIPEEKYTNAFLGYGPEDSHFVIELTYSKLSDWRFTFVTPLLNSEATEFEMNLCKNTG